MNYDVFTAAAIAAELNDKLSHGRIQDSLELGEASIGLEIYAGQRYYLLLSADPQTARVHLVPDRVRRGVEQPSPLGLMLRRYIEGGRLITITQPAWERILHFHFENADGAFTLIAEIMDRRSNLLLVRDGHIMDCIRRVGADENRVRTSLPGKPYMPPPPQLGKRPPTELTSDFLAKGLMLDPAKLAWRTLTERLLGFSPMLAREVVYRAAGDSKAKAAQVQPDLLLEQINYLVRPMVRGEFEPGVLEQDGLVTGYAPYEITHLAGYRPTDGMSEALTLFYGAAVGAEAYEMAKRPIQAQVNEALDKAARRVEALKRSQRDDSERERLRQSGELLLAYQYQIGAGQTTFTALYDFDKPALEIPLDPQLSALDNAKHYFEKYEKAKRAMAEVPALLEAAETDYAYLQQLNADLALASNWTDIGEVQDALQAGGYWRGPKTGHPGSQKSGPLRVNTPEGFTIWVGRNARQNDEVTFVRGRPEDTWLHARGIPGAHVIIKATGRPVPPAIVQRAASLAAYYSPARNDALVLVDVTERRHVRKIKGGGPGLVTYRHEAPIQVAPAADKGSTQSY